MKDHTLTAAGVIAAALLLIAWRAYAQIRIEEPRTPPATGRLCRLPIHGAAPAELAAGKAALTCFPAEPATADMLVTVDGKPVIYFAAEQPGRYLLLLNIVRDCALHTARLEIQVADQPPPNPPPPPPAPTARRKLWLIPVWESSNPDRATNALVTSLSLQRQLAERGHRWAPTDQSAPADAAPILHQWRDRALADRAAARDTRPWLIIVAEHESTAAYSGPLPPDQAAILDLAKRHEN